MVFGSLFSRITDVKGDIRNIDGNCQTFNTNHDLGQIVIDSWNLQDQLLQGKCDYEPPNYGAPDSQYGSGTR